jgi:hypothetical protein
MRNPAPRLAADRPNSPKAIRYLRWTLMLLIVELTFEGLARKLNIKGTNVAIFLLKDVIVALIGIQVMRLRRPPTIDFLWAAYLVECILMLPPFLSTAAHDPILALFGAKEYLLYPMVAFGTFLAFEHASIAEIISFFRWLALLVIPTAGIAILQLHLPPTHWLNLSVEGESLEGFSAGGHLRVSSTFPFVAQYCAFINAEVFLTMIALNSLRDVSWFRKLIYLSIVPLLIISSYITGSRGAVLADLLIIAAAAGLSLFRFQARSALRVIVIIIGLLITLAVARYAMPDAFVAYSLREKGQLLGASSEIQARIYDTMFDWMGDVFTTPFLGYGLGVMSNGSELLSNYAANIRAFSWTETDFATTLFEGGIYLVVVWYGFRYFIIYQAVRHCLIMRGEELSLPAAFCVGFVVVVGFTATLGIQPPIAIWWWLSVGTAQLLWWKSVEPKKDADQPDDPSSGPPPPRKARGQSAYAARLHAKPSAA